MATSSRHAPWVVVVAIVGAVLVGCGDESAPPNPSGSAPDAATTANMYRGQLRRVCVEAAEKSRRDREAATDGVSIDSIIAVESDELDKIRKLIAPTVLAATHGEVVAVMGDRVAKLRSIVATVTQMDGQQLATSMAAADALSHQSDALFRTIGVPECVR